MRFAFIDAEKAEFPVRTMCRVRYREVNAASLVRILGVLERQ